MIDLIPYNFVPLEKKKRTVQAVNPFDKQLLRGWIECSMEIVTPLFIPNTAGDAFFGDNEMKIREFCSYDAITCKPTVAALTPKNPIIPGSSIRGVLRSVYEAATNSCMSTLRDGYTLSMRTPDTRNPGILKRKNGKYTITDAKVYKTDLAVPVEHNGLKKMAIKNPKTGTPFLTGCPVVFKLQDNGLSADMDTIVKDTDPDKPLSFRERRGIVHAGECFVNKRYDGIFVETSKSFEIDQDDFQSFIKVLELYGDPKNNKTKGHTGYCMYLGTDDLNLKRETGLPVYYLKHNGHCYISPAQMSRNVFFNRISRIADEMGNYAPCTGENGELCSACSLFGMVGAKGSGSARKGRIRITDATSIGEVRYGRFRKIAPQMSPKLSSMEFYTNQPASKPMGWTYDYACQVGKDASPLPVGAPQLKGRKFYWHHKPSSKDYVPPKNVADRFCQTIRPIEEGVFSFKIFLDGVTETELKQLIALIQLDGDSYAHKLGAAKALGYGSIKMTVDTVMIETAKVTDETIELSVEHWNEHSLKTLTLSSVFNEEDVRDSLKALLSILEYGVSSHSNVRVSHLDLAWYKNNRITAGRFVLKEPNIVPRIVDICATIKTDIQNNH